MKVQSLFLAALDLPDPAARQAYLEEACEGDDALRAEVESLLTAHAQAGSFLEKPLVVRPADAATPQTPEATIESKAPHPADPDETLASDEHQPADADDEDKGADLTFLAPSTRPGALGKLAHYEILKELGRGGFGIVFEAFDEKLERIVAIKVIAPHLAATSPPRKRFLREARAAAAVRHDNVVRIYAVDDHPIPYLVMEYVAGKTLQQTLDEDGPFEAAQIAAIGRQIALGLAAAHAVGLIHRDVKPANILLEVDPETRVKITDFGLARAVDDASLTGSGLIAGTPMYMAPEQARGEAVDFRSDLFALGSVLYAATTGRPPFRAATTMAVLKRVCDDEPRPIPELIPETPEWFCRIVSKLHAKKPESRYASAREVAEALLLGAAAPPAEKPLRKPSTLGGPKATDAAADTAETNPSDDDAPLPDPYPVPLAIRGGRTGEPRLRPFGAILAACLLVFACGLAISEAAGVTDVRGTVLRIFSPHGTLVVEVGDPDVQVTIDGEELVVSGAGVRELRVKPGSHQLVARKGEAVVQREIVTVDRDGRRVVRITAEPAPDAAGGAAPATTSPGPAPTTTQSPRPAATAPAPNPPPAIAAGSPGTPPPQPAAWLTAWGKASVTAEVRAMLAGDPSRPVDGLVQVLGRPDPIQWKGIDGLAYSRDGSRLATVSWDHTVLLYDAATGAVLRAWKNLPEPPRRVAFGGDGKTLVVGFPSGLLRLYSTEENAPLQDLHYGQAGEIFGLAASGDGRYLAVGGTAGVVRLWSWGKWNAPQDFMVEPRSASVSALDLDSTGERIAVGLGAKGTEVKTIQLHRISDLKLDRAFETAAHVHALRFSPDGKYVGAVGPGDRAVLWDVADGKPWKTLLMAGGTVGFNLAWSPNAKTVAVGTRGGVELFDLPAGARRVVERPFNGDVGALAFHPDGGRLAVGDSGGSLSVVDPAKATIVDSDTGHRHRIACVAIAPDSRAIFSCGDDGTLRRWPLDRPGEPPLVRRSDCTWIGLSSTGAAAAKLGKGMTILDPQTLEERFPLEGAATVGSISWSPDGKTLAGEATDGVVRLWDAGTGRELHRFPHLGNAARLAYHDDGKRLAGVSAQTGRLAVWDLATGKEVPRKPFAEPPAFDADRRNPAAAFSPDLRRLAIGRNDGSIELWDLVESVRLQRIDAHPGKILRLRWTDQGRTLVSAGSEGAVRVWDEGADRPRATFFVTEPDRGIYFCLDHSGRYVFAGGHPAILAFRIPERGRKAGDDDLATPPLPRTDRPPPSAALAALKPESVPSSVREALRLSPDQPTPDGLVAVLGEPTAVQYSDLGELRYSPDGRLLASGAGDRSIVLREASTGKIVRVWRDLPGAVHQVSFSPDGKTLAVGFPEGPVRLLPVAGNAAPIELESSPGGLRALAVSPDGKFLAVGGNPGVLRIWSWGKWNEPRDFPIRPEQVSINSLEFHPDGEPLAVGLSYTKAGRNIQLFKVADGVLERSFECKALVNRVRFGRDGKFLAAVSWADAARIWNVETGEEAPLIHTEDVRGSNAVAWSPDGRMLAVGSDRKVSLVDVASGARIYGDFEFPTRVNSLAFRPDGTRLAAGDLSGQIVQFDPATGGSQERKEGHRHLVRQLALAADGASLLTSGDDGTLRRWRLDPPGAGEVVHRRPYAFTQQSPDGRRVAVRLQKRLLLLDAATFQESATLETQLTMFGVVWSPDGKSLAGVGEDGVVRLWDADSGKEVRSFPKIGTKTVVSFSRDGKTVAAASNETNRAAVWDAASGVETRSFEAAEPFKLGGRWGSLTAAFTPDHERLSTASVDGMVTFWNVETGARLRRFAAHRAEVQQLAWLDGGRTLVSSSLDGTVRVWEDDAEEPKESLFIGPTGQPVSFTIDPSEKYLFAVAHPSVLVVRLAERAAARPAGPPLPSAELASLQADAIPPEVRKALGDGHSRPEPAGLVAVLGAPAPILSGEVLSLAYSKDGRWLAAGSPGDGLLVYDARTERPVRAAHGMKVRGSGLAFHPDGALVVLETSGRIEISDVPGGAVRATLSAIPGAAPGGLAVSPDGRFLAVGSANGSTRVWKWGEWNTPRDFRSKLKGLGAILAEFSPDGERLAIGYAPPKWDGPTAEIVRTADLSVERALPTMSHVVAFAFTRDGKRLAVGEWARKATLWNLDTGEKTAEISLKDSTGAGSVVFSADEKKLFLRSNNNLEACDVATGGCVPLAAGKHRPPRSIALRPDGKRLAVGDVEGQVLFLDPATADLGERKEGHAHFIRTISVHPQGWAVLTAGNDRTFRRFRFDLPGLEAPYRTPCRFIEYSPDGKSAAAGLAKGLALLDAETFTPRKVLEEAVGFPTAVWSPDGKTIAGAGDDGVIRVWNAADGSELRRFPRLGLWARLAFDAEGKALAAVSGEKGVIVVWDLATGAARSLPPLDEAMKIDPEWKLPPAAAFNVDLSQLALGKADGVIDLWDLRTGAKLRSFEGCRDRVHQLAWIEGGRTLVGSAYDGVVRIWSADSPRARQIHFIGPAGRPVVFAFDASEKYLFAAGHPSVLVIRLDAAPNAVR